MHPVGTDFDLVYPYRYLPVLLNGVLLGYIDPNIAPQLVKSLRALKIQQLNTDAKFESVPKTLEVAYLPATFVIEEEGQEANPEQSTKQTGKNKFFPGIFLTSTVARFTRPVMNLEVGGVEWIGPLEQVNMSIACLEEDIRSDTTH